MIDKNRITEPAINLGDPKETLEERVAYLEKVNEHILWYLTGKRDALMAQLDALDELLEKPE